jgi:isoleucyl-tRNA synthetase
MNDGTGIVHLAPEFGLDDFIVAQQHHINVSCTINDQGYFTDQCLLSEC